MKRVANAFRCRKCKVIHIGSNNPNALYKMRNITLSEVNEEKDLGVITKDLKAVSNCGEVVRKANRIIGIGMIKHNFQDKSVQTILPLYKSLVRPKVEYCIQAWRPYLKKDIEQLERVQERATRLVKVLDTCLMLKDFKN